MFLRAVSPVIVSALVLAACSSATDGTPAPTHSAAPSPEAEDLDCSGQEMRTPSGDLLDLSGTWEGGSTTFYLRQHNHCVWWMGVSAFPNQAPGDCFTNTYAGRLGDDFFLRGEWASIVIGGGECAGTTNSGLAEAFVTLALDFDCDGCANRPVLRDPWYKTSSAPSPYFYTPELRWVRPLPASQALR
jgi:hypothetical protein